MRVERLSAFAGPGALGNPAGVVFLDSPLSPERMRVIAKSVGYSETAFLCSEGDRYRLRWFSPVVEIPLCGHATLASAYALWWLRGVPQVKPLEFNTLSGLLSVRTDGEWIEMDFPSDPPMKVPSPESIERALGAHVRAAAKSKKWILELADADAVKRLAPDHVSLARAEGAIGIGVTARGKEHEDYDYVCRYFAPYAGVPEDPVTGSLQCSLAPYWSERLGKKEFLVFQASERGGLLRVRLQGGRVLIAGKVTEDSPLDIDDNEG